MADAATVSVLIKARDEASAQLKKVEGNMGRLSESFSKHRRSIGMAAAGIGAAISGIALLSVKSSLDQEIGIRTLDQAMKRVGESYDSNKEKIEALISAQQNKTNFGDEEQRKALEKLITIGGTYDGSLEALKVTTDLAAGANMNLEAAALLVGKAIAGETSSLSRYGIVIEKGASQTQIMAALTAQFGGSAEAAADPIVQLKNRLGDLMQVFGDLLLPVLETLLPKIELFIRDVIAWAEEHPTLTKVIGLTAAALGAVLLVVGPLLLVLPTLAAAFGLLSVAMGPITLAAIGIAAAVTAAIIIYKKWDDWNREVKIGVVLLGVAIAAMYGPIGLLAAAVAAGILVWKNWDEVVGFMRKAIADFGSTTISWIRKLMEGVQTLASWVPGLGDVEDALQSGINKLEDMESSIDQWSVSSKDRLRDMGNAWGGLQDEHHSVAGAVKANNETITTSTTQLANVIDTKTEEMVHGWGAVEDAMKEATVARIEEINEVKTQEEKHAYLVKLGADSRKSAFKAELDAFMEMKRHQGDVYDGMLDDASVYYDMVAQKAKESADKVIAETHRATADAPHIGQGMRATAQAAYAGADVLPVGSSFDSSGWNKFSTEQQASARMDWSGMSDQQLRSIQQSSSQEAVKWAAAQERFKRNTATSSFRPGNMLTAESDSWTTFEAAKLAQGGIVTKPTLGLVGEAGPEAVIPLGRGGGMGTTNNFHFHGAVYGVEDLK